MNKTPQYITDLLKPLSETHYHTIDKRRSKIYCNRVFDCHLSILFLSIFDPRSSIVKMVFDCRLPGVIIVH